MNLIILVTVLFIEVLEGLNREGIILLVVTHDPDIGGRARRRIRMVDGRISEDDH